MKVELKALKATLQTIQTNLQLLLQILRIGRTAVVVFLMLVGTAHQLALEVEHWNSLIISVA